MKRTNAERYQEMMDSYPANNFREGDVVLIYGKPRLVTYVSGGLVKTGKGRGYSQHWSLNNISRIIVRNFKLKPGRSFDGVTG